MRKQYGIIWTNVAAWVVILGLLAGVVMKWLEWT